MESWGSQQPSGVTCSKGDPPGTADWGVCSSKGVRIQERFRGTRKVGELGTKIRGKTEKESTVEVGGEG